MAALAANVIWFRHGLRLHDNPALQAALLDQDQGVALIPIFIFDGESAGTKSVGYNRMRFLLDSLEDINEQLQKATENRGRLWICQGQPVDIFRRINEQVRLIKICVEQDCEPIWNERDNAVRNLCRQLDVEYVEKVSHTLWDPRLVMDTNGGIAPLTYQMFLHTVHIIGLPPRPVDAPNLQRVSFVQLSPELADKLGCLQQSLTPEQFNVYSDNMGYLAKTNWRGGETQALLLLGERLKVEQHAFERGFYLPNQAMPNILEPPKSMSAHLRFGCLSVRRFYWSVHDLFKNVQLRACVRGVEMTGGAHITSQLIWREYFYTMSVNNPQYDRMEGNEICLSIPWAKPHEEQLQRWRLGQTGFPLIDAAMRQLLAEGWLHHTLRNTVATFLTRGGLWQNWEHGLQHFLKYLLDADWSVCAGNWMWVSSSAFERLLDSSLVTCPVALAKRLDPQGVYIRQYVPELKRVPREFIHEPWRMNAEQQERFECLVGIHYPERIIDLEKACKRNMLAMRALRHSLIEPPPHCRPSNEEEVRQFFWLAD
ncbi:cry [Drosophila busckii]|uniref:Cryptochrome-1 n=1 Tax=Drosophila busckii TaxID=30019 RepID=A0A0M4EPM8_DROBS|nr:cryptochrome-1 [Drosophila busckii]ALC47765.1 cry [Drosophila busckii]